MIASKTSKDVVWLLQFCRNIEHEHGPMPICWNNKSAIALAKNPKFHPLTKHIMLKFHYIKEVVEFNEGTKL
jgi:hypothetical protein